MLAPIASLSVASSSLFVTITTGGSVTLILRTTFAVMVFDVWGVRKTAEQLTASEEGDENAEAEISEKTAGPSIKEEEEVADQVRRTVVHEVAHHFGIDDDRLTELGW